MKEKPGKPLDLLGADEILALMDAADKRALRAVASARHSIARAAEAAAASIGAGGRLIYVGAGTSGRLGVLDASECPPTFSANPGQVVGIIAGGKKALTEAVEGAEDDARAGKSAISRLRVNKADTVVGITASGTTPYVLAALDEAGKRGATTWLMKCSGTGGVDNEIALDTGAEVIEGSTRLAAGTATKLALNRITTAAFVMLGKVHGNLMVDVIPSNAKLVKRACGIIVTLTGCNEAEAAGLLKKAGNSPKTAVLMKLRGLTRRGAERLLDANGGSLRRALEG